MSSLLDFSGLSDDQLVGLIREALAEALKRGGAVEAAVRSAGVDETEKARIARDAAEREARRLRAEEERRIAEEAAARVRREAEEAAAQARRDGAARLREIARTARTLFGSDCAEFTVSFWEKAGDRRIYIGRGYGANWAEYHHDGNARTAPGAFSAIDAVVKPLAAHRGISAKEARGLIRDFCADLIGRDFRGRLEVNESNAPLDPACRRVGWVVWDGDPNRPWYLRAGKTHATEASGADFFATEAEAREAAAREGKPDWKVIEKSRWSAFPAAEEASR